MGEKAQPISFSKLLTKSDVQVDKTAQLTIPKECGTTLFPREGGFVRVRDRTTGKIWLFRHGINGGPERHRLSTGWSGFVRERRPSVGDTVVFTRNHDGELLIDLRRRPAERAPQVSRDESEASSRVTVAIPPSAVPLSGYFEGQSSRAPPTGAPLPLSGFFEGESSRAPHGRVPLPLSGFFRGESSRAPLSRVPPPRSGFFEGESSRSPPSRVPLSGYFDGESSRARPPAKKLKIGGENPNRSSVGAEKTKKKKKQNIALNLNARAEGRGRRSSRAPLAGVRGARTTQSVDVRRSEVLPGNVPSGTGRRSIRLFGQTIWVGRDGGDGAEDDPSLNLNLSLSPPGTGDSTGKPRASP